MNNCHQIICWVGCWYCNPKRIYFTNLCADVPGGFWMHFLSVNYYKSTKCNVVPLTWCQYCKLSELWPEPDLIFLKYVDVIGRLRSISGSPLSALAQVPSLPSLPPVPHNSNLSAVVWAWGHNNISQTKNSTKIMSNSFKLSVEIIL